MDGLVTGFVRRTAPARWDWATMNCALWAADLVAEATGHDPAADLRGRHPTAFAWRRIVMREGGMAAFVRGRLGFLRGGEDRCGVAVARLDGRQVCGVLTGGRLAAKTDGGVRISTRFDLIDGWGLD